jgi:carbamoyl-phosphate synthase large subunit
MKSTGEVMGTGASFGIAFAKAQLAAGVELPRKGRVFLSVKERDRQHAVELGRELAERGFEIISTRGTGSALQQAGIACKLVNKVYEGRPHVVDMIKNNEIDFIINTTEGKQSIADSYTIRASALQQKVSYTTTIAGAHATVRALASLDNDVVTRLQDLHAEIKQGEAA